MGLLSRIRNRARSMMEPTATAPPATTPATPGETPAEKPSKLRTWIIRIVAGLVASGVGALLTYLTGTKIEVQIPVPQTAEQLRAELPFDYEGCPYHSDVEHLHADEAQAARWPTDRITYGVDYASAARLNPPLSEEAIRKAFAQGSGWWTEQADIELVEVPHSEAMIPISFLRLDGVGGTLAQAYLADGTNRQKPMQFDSSERWTAGPPASNLVSLPTVFCHELGHSLGLNHDSATAKAVMAPMYNSATPREQPRDYERLFQLGYRRRAKVPTPAEGTLSVPVTLKVSDVVKALGDAGYKVEPPPKQLAP